MNKLPQFKPLPEVDNLRPNYMSAFNNGMNIYEALVYLQGYVQITYKSMDDLINDWNNFEQYVTENISQIANEKTQEILNQWKSDGTLNEIIMQNPLWNQKVSKTGDVMNGDLQFQENAGVYGSLHSGTKVNMISHSYTGSDDYTQIGDDNAQAVVHSEKRPVWYDGSKNQDLLVEKDLEDLNLSVSQIQNKIESGAYFTENDEHPTITNYQGNKNVSILQPIDVVDNLSSTETELPLSALQGKILNDTINSIINASEYHVTIQNNGNVYLKKFGKLVVGVIIASNSYDNKTGTLGTLDREYRPLRLVYIPYIGWSGANIGAYGQYNINTDGSITYKTTETVHLERNGIFAYYTA